MFVRLRVVGGNGFRHEAQCSSRRKAANRNPASISGGVQTAYSADSEFVSGRVAKEFRHDAFSGKRLRAARTVTLEKAGKKITGQVMMEVVTGGKIS